MVTLVVILSLAVCVLGYTTFNLLRKNEKQEDVLTAYLLYMDNLSKIIEHSDQQIVKAHLKVMTKSVGSSSK